VRWKTLVEALCSAAEWWDAIYRVSHELRSLLRESVPYIKIYWYNPKHLCPKLNGYGDTGQRRLKLWQRLLTYWLSNTYWNWQEYVVSVILISVLNIKVSCEWQKVIKLNTKTLALPSFVRRFPSSLSRPQLMLSCDVRATLRWLQCTVRSHCRACAVDEYGVTDGVQYVDPTEAHTFQWPLSP
jgi:hypothetical protein